MENLTDFRSDFILPTGGPYLLSHAAGALPKATRAYFDQHYFAPWADHGNDAWEMWLSQITTFRSLLGQLLHAQTVDFCPKPNLSAALFSYLSAIKPHPSRNIILAHAHMFPSLGFVAQAAERLGFSLRLINEDKDPSDWNTWEEAMSEDIAVVIAMHAHSNTGLLSPVKAICEHARSKSIVSIIDIAQTVGIMPIDLRDWDADCVIGSCLKWLCGGPGAGFMWVNPKNVKTLSPIDVGWFSHENPFEMDIRQFRYAPDALKFWGGTPSIAPYVTASSGLTCIVNIGVETIFKHNRALIDQLSHLVPDRWQNSLDRTKKGGTLCIKTDSPRLREALKLGGCHFDQRGSVTRMSLHIWNSFKDIECIAQALTKAI